VTRTILSESDNSDDGVEDFTDYDNVENNETSKENIYDENGILLTSEDGSSFK